MRKGRLAYDTSYLLRVLNPPSAAAAAIEELDYHTYLARVASEQATWEVLTTRCAGCGAEWTMDANTVAGECPFCAHSLVLTGQSSRLIKPVSLLPFRVTRRDAEEALRTWYALRQHHLQAPVAPRLDQRLPL